MPRHLPTLTTASAIALAAVLAPASLAGLALLSGGRSVPATSRAHVKPVVRISGDLRHALRPGGSQPLDLRLSNRSRRSVRITKLWISLKIGAAHRRAGCSRARSFRVTRLKRGEYPITLPAGRTRSLRRLGVRRVPRVRMLNLASNQDACKGATLRLRYGARALPRHAVRRR